MFLLQPPKPASAVPPAPAFGVHRRCFALLSETLPRRRPGHPSTPPHLLLFSAECRPTPHPNQSSFSLPSVCDSTAASSPSLGRSSLGPCCRPLPRCARRGVDNIRVIGRGLYMESLTAGTHEVHGCTQGKFLLITHYTCTVHGKGFCISQKKRPPR